MRWALRSSLDWLKTGGSSSHDTRAKCLAVEAARDHDMQVVLSLGSF